MDQAIYTELVNELDKLPRQSRLDMVFFCIAKYGKVDKKILECIEKLHEDNFID